MMIESSSFFNLIYYILIIIKQFNAGADADFMSRVKF